jgi:integrase
MRTKLTPAFVAKAAAEAGKERSVYWDAALPCFGLMVTAAGHRSYVVQYRNAQGASRRKTLAGVLSLDKARKEARKIVGDVAKGHDPLDEERRKAAAAADTLQAVAGEFFKREGRKLRTGARRLREFERLIFPTLGSHPIGDIKRKEITRLLDKIEDENGPRAAHLVLAYLSRLMGWHASRDDEFKSPIVRGMGRINARERARSRILTDAELKAVWRAAEASQGPYGALLRFILLTATRRGEAVGMMRAELVDGEWTIPAGRYKTKVDHIVPLSAAARAVLEAIPNLGAYVFTTDGRRSISDFSKLKREFDAVCGVSNWIVHDLRRTARSLMSRTGVNADIAERCLGHIIGGVRGVYDRHEYHDEKRRAFEALAAQIERIVNPQPNVVAVHGRV